MTRILRLALTIGALLAAGLPPTNATAATFEASDLTGTWHVHELPFDAEQDALWTYGTIVINETGGVTGGQVTASDGNVITLTGGTLSIDKQGVLSGVIQDASGSSTVSGGKMDDGKTFCSMVGMINTDYKFLATLIKDGGVFTQSDLAGAWRADFIIHGAGLSGAAAMGGYGAIDVDIDGNVTGWDFTLSDGSASVYDSGALTVSSDGRFTGSIQMDGGYTITVHNGKLNPSKTMAAVVATSDIGNGLRYYGHMTKEGGAYAQSDLTGRWTIAYIFRNNWFMGGQYWQYGPIILDAQGYVTGDRAVSSSGTENPFTGGQIALNADGVMSGDFSSSLLGDMTIVHGHMDMEKNMAFAIGWENDCGVYALWVKSPAVRGDVNDDGGVDLADAVIVLKVLTDTDVTGQLRSDYIPAGVDVNGDDDVGPEEAIYCLRKAAGM